MRIESGYRAGEYARRIKVICIEPADQGAARGREGLVGASAGPLSLRLTTYPRVGYAQALELLQAAIGEPPSH